MIKEKILDTIKKYNLIENKQHIVIGLSGGPDSVCLFHNLCEISSDMELTIHAVHINHKFRPGAAEEDQHFVEELCKRLKVDCRSFEFHCDDIAREEKISSEEAGRKVRYDSFAKVCEDLIEKGIPRNNIKIAVAQNLDDQSETILFRILRGVGTDGLSGIDYKRRDRFGNEIIRPLMDVTRIEIMEYLDGNNLEYRLDHTNLEPIYTRNKIRLNLIPYLEKEFNENIKKTIVRMGKIARTDREFIWQQANKTYDEAIVVNEEHSPNAITLDRDVLINVHKAVYLRVIQRALETIGLKEDISSSHLEAFEKILFSEKASAVIDLPNSFKIIKSYEKIIVINEKEKEKIKEKMSVSIVAIEDYLKKVDNLGIHAAFDLEKIIDEYGNNIEEQVKIRGRRPNDYIFIDKTARKKLQDLLVDDKIPKHIREEVEIAAIGSDCLWIKYPNKKGRYSWKFKLDEQTKNILLVEINIRL